MNPVRWFEIYVQDMARARRFYEAVFKVTLQQLNAPGGELEMWQFPSAREAPGSSGALVNMNGAPSGGLGTIVYFGSEDCAVEEQRVAPAGGKVHRPKMSIGPYGFITLAVDPDGNMFGIHSMK
jgi:hypothetical protein